MYILAISTIKINRMKKMFLLILPLIYLMACTPVEEEPTDEEQPTVPKIFDIVGQFDMNDGPHALAVKGSYVFASRDDKIYIVNVSDVTKPVSAGVIDDLENANIFEALLIEGNTLYAGCTSTGGVYVIDVSNPASPSIVNKFTADIYSGKKISPLKLFYANNVLWAAGSNGLNTMLVKYTVSGNTLTADKYWTSNTTGDIAGGVWANATHVFISTAKGTVHSFNSSDISAGPLSTYTFNAEAGHSHWGKTIIGHNNNLYWADWGAGFINVNISDPANLKANTLITHSSYKAQHPDAEGTNVYDLAMNTSTGKIYAANGWSGLLQIDVNATDKVEKFVDYHEHQYYCITLYDKYAIVGNISGGISGTKGLKIIKIQD